MAKNKTISIKDEEVFLADEEFIVSKTDLRGNILYANRTFMSIASYSEGELLGQPHSIMRHPDMPKGVFKLLWQTIKKGNEFFGFVKNLCSDGRYYWVFANVTPAFDQHNVLVGYLSVRRKPPATAIKIIEPIYQHMLKIEQSASSNKTAEQESIKYLQEQLDSLNVEYQSFAINLFNEKT